MVGFSHVLKGWFVLSQRRMHHHQCAYITVVFDTALAIHRFDKLSKPLGRVAIKYVALIDVAERIVVERDGDDRRDAKIFLVFVSTEVMLQLAMLADAANKGSQFFRHFDDEHCDTSNDWNLGLPIPQPMQAFVLGGRCPEDRVHKVHAAVTHQASHDHTGCGFTRSHWSRRWGAGRNDREM